MIFETCIEEIILKCSDGQKEEGTPGRATGLCKKGHWKECHKEPQIIQYEFEKLGPIVKVPENLDHAPCI